MELQVSVQSGAGDRDPSGKKGRARTCVGCGERVDVGDAHAAPPLVRLILGPGGVVAVDPGDGGFGRGAHVHPRRDCLGAAVARGLSRSAKGRVHAVHLDVEAKDAAGADVAASVDGAEGVEPLTAASLSRAIRQAMDRRIQGLIRAAVRSQRSAIGADAVRGACGRGEASLVVVACDAAAGAELPEVRTAIAEGRAVAWGTKQGLGALTSGPRQAGVAVVAITSGSIGAAIYGAVHIADSCASVERGDGANAGGRAGPGRRSRRTQQAGGRTNPGESPGDVRATAGTPGSDPRAPGGELGSRDRAAEQRPGSQDEEVSAVGREGRAGRRGGAGRLLASEPETGESGAAGSIGGAPGASGRVPTVDGVAANRRPRGWVRRIG
jgi:predicted RNA-binding protein YlxR (DUF448 family)